MFDKVYIDPLWLWVKIIEPKEVQNWSYLLVGKSILKRSHIPMEYVV